MPDQSGKTTIVTGANSGIGYETAKALYEAGAHVIMCCRDADKCSSAAASIETSGGKGKLDKMELDLSDLNSIAAFSKKFTSLYRRLDVLINNAGVNTSQLGKTATGFEQQFGVNFIGPFALTGRLYPLLKITPGARIVTVSSMAYQSGTIDFDNLKAEKGYDTAREYGQSKLADMMFALELQRRIQAKGDSVLSVAVQPGANKTELSRHMSQEELNTAVAQLGGLMEPWQGALPSLYAATMPDVKGGAFYSPNEAGGYRGYPALAAVAPHALDEQVAARLYTLAEDATGVRFP